MRLLPAVDILKAAVGQVIASNTTVGYPPTYFYPRDAAGRRA